MAQGCRQLKYSLSEKRTRFSEISRMRKSWMPWKSSAGWKQTRPIDLSEVNIRFNTQFQASQPFPYVEKLPRSTHRKRSNPHTVWLNAKTSFFETNFSALLRITGYLKWKGKDWAKKREKPRNLFYFCRTPLVALMQPVQGATTPNRSLRLPFHWMYRVPCTLCHVPCAAAQGKRASWCLYWVVSIGCAVCPVSLCCLFCRHKQNSHARFFHKAQEQCHEFSAVVIFQNDFKKYRNRK